MRGLGHAVTENPAKSGHIPALPKVNDNESGVMSLLGKHNERPVSYGRHGLENVPLSAIEAGALDSGSPDRPAPPDLPGSGEGVTSLLDLATPGRLAIGAAILAALAILVLR